MVWLLIFVFVLFLIYQQGFKVTVLAILMVLLSIATLFVSFIFGALLLFLYDDSAIRAWTLPNLRVNEILSTDSLGLLLLGLPFFAAADFLRILMHLLIQHAHVVTWVTVIIGMYSIIQMWTSGVIAWLNFRNSKACLEEAVVPPDLGKDGKADTPWSRYE